MTLTGKRLPRIRTLLRFANMRLRKRKKNLEWKGISILRERNFIDFVIFVVNFVMYGRKIGTSGTKIRFISIEKME